LKCLGSLTSTEDIAEVFDLSSYDQLNCICPEALRTVALEVGGFDKKKQKISYIVIFAEKLYCNNRKSEFAGSAGIAIFSLSSSFYRPLCLQGLNMPMDRTSVFLVLGSLKNRQRSAKIVK